MDARALTKVSQYLKVFDEGIDDEEEARELAVQQRVQERDDKDREINNYQGREGAIERFIFPQRGISRPRLVRVDNGADSDFTQAPPTTPGGGEDKHHPPPLAGGKRT
jgi:hypothetical protein